MVREEVQTMSEAAIQREVVKFVKSMVKVDPRYDMLVAIPNGGYRGRAQRQGAGFRAGVPDLFLAWSEDLRDPYYAGLFIELKTPKGAVSAEQLRWHDRLRWAGYRVVVCRSAQEAIDTIRDYLG